MSETCRTCKKKFDSGIWLAPEFVEEGVLLFCSEKCKREYLKRKLRAYPQRQTLKSIHRL